MVDLGLIVKELRSDCQRSSVCLSKIFGLICKELRFIGKELRSYSQDTSVVKFDISGEKFVTIIR